MSSQRIGKYACLEIERRYLLHHLPEDLNKQVFWHIIDRYLDNTRLRLRRMTSASGQQIFKFTQKYQTLTQNISHNTITNIYLNEVEYGCLATLAVPELVKKRYTYEYQDQLYGIDVFAGILTGLILAEVEGEHETDVAELATPTFAVAEVTTNPFFRGGNLAKVTGDELKNELSKTGLGIVKKGKG